MIGGILSLASWSVHAAGPPPLTLPAGAKRAIVAGGPPPPLMKLADVRPGMVGEALTVFHGTKPEPFKVRVVAILRQFLPKQDVILIRAEDPRVEHSGIVAGMSGSPVYIEGKLVGAIAYAWSFAKEPLGGVTPIETMLSERERPRRKSPIELAAGGGDERGLGLPTAAADDRREMPEAAAAGASGGHLVRASVPLSVSGFGPRAIAEMSQLLGPVGLVPTQGGGGRALGAGKVEPGRVEPGSAIGVELVRGDMSMVGTGTVTYVDGATVLAFGHPMFGIGESYLPLVDAEIHTFMPSLAQSFKMSSPLHEIGVLVQDRQSCILGNLDGRTTMMPVDVRVTGPEGKTRAFHAEVARNRRLTPTLASLVVANAITDAEPDVTDVVATVNGKLTIQGREPLVLTDHIFSSEGISGRVLGGSRGLRALGELMFNPFEPVTVERMDIDVRVEQKRDVAEIVAISAPTDTVRAGDTVPVRVTLRPYAGPEYVETVAVKIPYAAAGQAVHIEAASGVMARPEAASAENLGTYIENMKKFYTAANLVVTVQTPDEGAAVRGRLIPTLPAAAMDTLRPANLTRRADSYRIAERTVFPSKRLVSGRQELTIAVVSDVLGHNR
ncbi:MAG TPA: SpoIVB peptidase S55 domain-containing protein [Polyangia bacterium]|nr:SpoIVB peptidase S55 domain-containing protein [Polyangia bacterium]